MSADDTPRCWMCEAPADSAEHRLKKRDIVRAYGAGPYRGPSAPLHVIGGTQRAVQGPGARTLTYSQNLCLLCNTTRSQPYDRAYDTLIDWIAANEKMVLHKRFINLFDVYGASFADDQLDLYKYFAKSFGCRLVDASQSVPQDIVALFDLRSFQTALRITFSVNEDILLMRSQDRDKFIGKSGLYAHIDTHDPQSILAYEANEHVSWFTTNYWYDCAPNGDYGSTWVADAQHIYLGSHAPLTDEARAELSQSWRVIARSCRPTTYAASRHCRLARPLRMFYRSR